MSEEQIIEQILNGNIQFFDNLVEKYQSMVFRTAMGFVHSKEDAEDITQDVFIKAFQSINSFRKQAGFQTWLYRITVNTSLNHLNRNKKNFFLQLSESVSEKFTQFKSGYRNPEQEAIENQKDGIIQDALNSLPEKQKIAFILSKYDELSQKQIAEIINCSEGSVEQYLQRAKLNLQKKISRTLFYE